MAASQELKTHKDQLHWELGEGASMELGPLLMGCRLVKWERREKGPWIDPTFSLHFTDEEAKVQRRKFLRTVT